MQHPATDLTQQPLQAIDLFARGQSISCIARAVGVTRETLWRWRQQEAFSCELRERQRQRYDSIREQTAELLDLAMASLTRELHMGAGAYYKNTTKTAFKVLDFIQRNGLMCEAPPENRTPLVDVSVHPPLLEPSKETRKPHAPKPR